MGFLLRNWAVLVRRYRSKFHRITLVQSALFALLLVAALPAFGAHGNWLAQTWQSDDGLPDNNVTGVVQAEDGYLWVATTAGLARFDGVKFREFIPLQLPDVRGKAITSIFIDRQHRLWLATIREAIFCIEPKSQRVFRGSNLQDAPPTVMTQDAEQAIWIAYPQGDVARIKDDRIDRLGAQQGLPDGGPVWFTADREGQIWFSRDNRIGLFRNGRFIVLLTLNERALRIAASRDGGIWIAGSSKIYRFKEGSGLEVRGRLPQVNPTALLEDRTGALWIGTDETGLLRHHNATLESVSTSHTGISSIFEDKDGSIWVGTKGGGINRVKPRAIEVLGTETGLPFESVRSVTEDSEGTLWVAGHDGTLVRRQGGRWKIASREKSWPGGNAVGVIAAPSGGVWISTAGNGLLRFQNGRYQVWRAKDGLAGDRVRSLFVTAHGDLWLSTDAPRKLQRFRDGKWLTFDVPVTARYVRAMTEAPNGDVWIGTSAGTLFRATGDSLVDETAHVQTAERSIRSLYATPDGSLWIGYADAGVGRWKAGKLGIVSMAQGLWENGISQIVSDGANRLWFIGDHGIFRVQLSEMMAAAEGRLAHIHSVVYRRSEGLPSLQGSNDVVPRTFRSRDGRLWMATRLGVAVVSPYNSPDNPTPPKVILEKVTVDGRVVAVHGAGMPLLPDNLRDLPDTNSDLVLSPGHRNIELDFTALSFSSPENVAFRYRLEGFDNDWVEAGSRRSTTYTRLSAGNYRFRVIACNEAGVWNETGVSLNIKVIPFFWQTWWFRLIALAGLTLLIASIVRYILQRRLQLRLRTLAQEAALSEERARIAQDLHDDLGARLTEATLLLEMAAQDQGGTNGHIQEGIATVRQAIRSLDETVWAVNPRNNTLPELIDYIGQYGVEFLRRASVRCHLDLPDRPPESPVTFRLRHNLFLTLKEALNNVARHAHATEVQLRLTVDDHWLRLVVSDNGCGFAQLPDDSLADGVRNMRHRTEKVNGYFVIESHPGAGTRVTIAYPWSAD